MSQTPLINPVTQSTCFGYVPEKITKKFSIPFGEIRLPIGKHRGPNKGFGAKHIWEEHELEMRSVGFVCYEDVPSYVASILLDNTPIHYEGNSFRHTRVMAVRSSRGTCILELRERRDETIWSVVTAYSGTKPSGVKVGTIQLHTEP